MYICIITRAPHRQVAEMVINSSLMTLFVKMLTVFKSPLLKVLHLHHNSTYSDQMTPLMVEQIKIERPLSRAPFTLHTARSHTLQGHVLIVMALLMRHATYIAAELSETGVVQVGFVIAIQAITFNFRLSSLIAAIPPSSEQPVPLPLPSNLNHSSNKSAITIPRH